MPISEAHECIICHGELRSCDAHEAIEFPGCPCNVDARAGFVRCHAPIRALVYFCFMRRHGATAIQSSALSARRTAATTSPTNVATISGSWFQGMQRHALCAIRQRGARLAPSCIHWAKTMPGVNELAGVSCVLRRGEPHAVVAIDRSLSPIAVTVQNQATGAMVETELSCLSLPGDCGPRSRAVQTWVRRPKARSLIVLPVPYPVLSVD